MSTRSIGPPAAPARKVAALPVTTRTPASPRERVLRLQTAAAPREESTRVTSPAPRLAASSPSAPDPAHRSSTLAPSSTP